MQNLLIILCPHFDAGMNPVRRYWPATATPEVAFPARKVAGTFPFFGSESNATRARSDGPNRVGVARVRSLGPDQDSYPTVAFVGVAHLPAAQTHEARREERRGEVRRGLEESGLLDRARWRRRRATRRATWSWPGTRTPPPPRTSAPASSTSPSPSRRSRPQLLRESRDFVSRCCFWVGLAWSDLLCALVCACSWRGGGAASAGRCCRRATRRPPTSRGPPASSDAPTTPRAVSGVAFLPRPLLFPLKSLVGFPHSGWITISARFEGSVYWKNIRAFRCAHVRSLGDVRYGRNYYVDLCRNRIALLCSQLLHTLTAQISIQ